MEGSRPNIMCFPEKLSYENARVYLYLLGVNHIVLIDNLRIFYRYHKKIVCFDCKRFFNHKDLPTDLEPNAICIYIETQRHIFNEKIFCDDNLPKVDLTEKTIVFQYSNEQKPISNVCMKVKRTCQKVSPNFEKKLKQEFDVKQEKTALDKFMLYLCARTLTNYTFIVSDNNDMLTILQAFLKT